MAFSTDRQLLRCLLPLTLAVLVGAGCQTPIHPRSADVARPGKLGWDVHIPLTTVAIGTVEGQGVALPEQPVPVEWTGNTGGLGDGTALTILPFWWEFAPRFGVFEPCEIGLLLSFFRVGGEARCQVLREDQAPVALSLGAAGAFLPGFERNAGQARLSLDLSRHVADLGWMLNLAVTRGTESHRLLIDDPSASIGYTPPPPNQSYDGEAIPYLQLARQETRLAAAVGVGFPIPETGLEFILGLAPYVILDAGPLSAATCTGCNALEVSSFREDFGVSLTLGVGPGLSPAPTRSAPP